jgi:hypothetical protein
VKGGTVTMIRESLKGDAELEKLSRDFVSHLAGRPCMLQFSEDMPMSEWKRAYPLVARVVSEYGCGTGQPPSPVFAISGRTRHISKILH